MRAQDLHELVRAEGLLGGEGLGGAGDGPIVAMVSGGRDSVCLLDVAVAVRGPAAVRVLHVNYGLRDEDSDADERLVRELCARLGVAFELVRVRADERARAGERGNLQAWARELRYREAERLAVEVEVGGEAGEIDVSQRTLNARAYVRARTRARVQGEMRTLIATGHTASDQVETILYRLAASPGRRALLGMAPREGRIVRPLLGITREQTAGYCRARGLDWREDVSNDDSLYARARVRNRLVPALRSVHPAAQRSVLRTAQLLRDEAELLNTLVEAELGDDAAGAGVGAGGASGSGCGGEGEDGGGISIARLSELHPALARLIVIRLAEDASGGYVPQAGLRVDEILALGARGGAGEVHVGGNVAARIEGGVLRMVALPSRAPRA